MGSKLPVRRSEFKKVETIGWMPKADHMDDDTLYVMIKPASSAISFKCPCSCGSVIDLKLGAESDAWSLKYDNGITLRGSVQFLHDCNSHFWIRNNQVEWA